MVRLFDAQGVAPQVFDEMAAVFERYLGLNAGHIGLRDDDVAFLASADQKAVPPRFKAPFRIVFLDQSEGAAHIATPRTRCLWEYLFLDLYRHFSGKLEVNKRCRRNVREVLAIRLL